MILSALLVQTQTNIANAQAERAATIQAFGLQEPPMQVPHTVESAAVMLLHHKARYTRSTPDFKRLARHLTRPLQPGQRVLVDLSTLRWGLVPWPLRLRRGRVVEVFESTVAVAIEGPLGNIVRTVSKGRVRG